MIKRVSIDVKKILKKKKPKGNEIGQLLILSTLFKGDKPLFTQAEYDNMVKSVDNENDVKLYNTYLNVHNKIIQDQAALELFKQQALNGYTTLSSSIQEAISYEAARRTIAEFPLIMTENQYNELLQQAMDMQRNITLTYYGLMFHCIGYFTGEYTEKIPKPPEPLKIALENLKSQPVSNPLIFDIICRQWHLGSYALPDGRKSNEIALDEYNAELERLLSQKNGGKDNVEMYWLYDLKADEITIKHDAWTNNRIADILDLEFICDYSEISNYSKYDVLFGERNILEVLMGDINDKKLSPLDIFHLFKGEFAELYYTLKSYLGNRKGLEVYRTAANELDIFEKTITWGELADNRIMNFGYYMKVSDRDILDMIDQEKDFNCGVKNGIAIIKDPSEDDLDENGYYKNTRLDFADTMFRSVNKFYESEIATEYFKDTREQIYISALREIFAYDIYYDVLASETGIDELRELKADEELFALQAADINKKTTTLAKYVSEAYSAGGEKELLKIKTVFPLININSLKPSKKAIETFKKEISGLNIFNEPVRLYNAFTTLKNSGNGGVNDGR